MALRFTSSVLGASEMRRDLEALQIGLGAKLTDLRREAAEILARQTAANAPYGPGPQSPRDNLPHLRDTITSRASGVVSTHPAALVHEYGGTIEPRGVPIQIPRREMAARAVLTEGQRVEETLARSLDDLLASTVR